MRILILNGNPDPADSGWEASLEDYSRQRREAGDTVTRVDLRDLAIRFCTGCWSCWYTTPGLCAIKDDMAQLYPQILAADVTVWASPLVLGNVTALTKKAQDRFIPLLHPYFALDRGEMHH
ncbi:MAG TPA: flavodoxin family protein, partial [bacterium]|nr:flavodoxin family protein [bacterium]